MIIIPTKKNEDRKKYLVRLAIAYIRNGLDNGAFDETLLYDEAQCDGLCLVEDLEIEFDL